MASSFSSATPKLIIPEEKSTSNTGNPRASSEVPSLPPIPTNSSSSSNATTTKKLTKILSAQTSFDRHHQPHPVAKRFSIDADPSSIILNTSALDFSTQHSHPSLNTDSEESPSPISNSLTNIIGKEVSPIRSPPLRQSDSFLEIPYEKGEIADLLKLADDPNSAAHVTNDGHEVLLEHSAVVPQ